MSGSGTPSTVARVLIVAAVASVLVLPASTARANHIAGATYDGTISGGGTISFTISGDGSKVDSLSLADVPGEPSCTFTSASTGNIAISNHTFSRTVTYGISVSGTFPSLGNAEGTVRIVNPPPFSCDTGTETWTATTPFVSIQFQTGSLTVDEGGGTAQVVVTRDGESTGAVSAQFSITGGTAAEGSDYAVTSPQTISFGDGDTVAKSVSIGIENDLQAEGAETVTMQLANPTGGALIGNPGTASLTITDNDSAAAAAGGQVTITSSSPKVKEGKVAKFNLTRSGDTSQPLSVPFTTANGTAKAPKDYKASSGTLSLAPGETTKQVAVKTKDDKKDEKTEKFFLKLILGTNVVQATAKTKDND